MLLARRDTARTSVIMSTPPGAHSLFALRVPASLAQGQTATSIRIGGASSASAPRTPRGPTEAKGTTHESNFTIYRSSQLTRKYREVYETRNRRVSNDIVGVRRSGSRRFGPGRRYRPSRRRPLSLVPRATHDESLLPGGKGSNLGHDCLPHLVLRLLPAG